MIILRGTRQSGNTANGEKFGYMVYDLQSSFEGGVQRELQVGNQLYDGDFVGEFEFAGETWTVQD
ncbi:hypothetical protein HAU47_06765 [Weissella confusa]|uniref:hypothetical protein n=1 Tax=Weissella confusa TaxID=1583 RepID=UPI0018F19BFA|nr:hypothetical protein [Weissella confusa]MBJ7620172.1 hypothetical protein [Weissella confusa]MBJ7667620.1 hypothetical protein [Weissella confusa]